MEFFAYLRVSTEQQAESGAGLEGQRLACRGYASSKGSVVAREFVDEGISGSLSIEKRPGILEALSHLRKDAVLLVAKRDRIGRDPLVVAMIEASVRKKGARILSAAGEGTDGEDPSSILMRRMVDAFSEYERLIIKARTKAALSAKKSRGERVGHIPFGYRLAENGLSLEKMTSEQTILMEMHRLKKSGLSLRKIARALNEISAFNRGNRPWNHASIHRILGRER